MGEKKTTFSKLLPGYKAIDKNKNLSKIGKFEFTFYYMKKQLPNKEEEKKILL